jgi:hypothetical protein
MKSFITGILVILITLILLSGCTQSLPAPQPYTPAVTPPVTTTAPLTETSTAAIATSPPQAAVTIIHYIVPTKAWKYSDLHMAFHAPEDWNVTTRLVSLPEGSQGLVYRTDLVLHDGFFIMTYPISLNQDQAYRDTFRTWNPVPNQTTVTINGIIYDRFESSSDGKSHVGYIIQKSSANDLGFASVLVYSTDDVSRPFDKADYESVISSFTYFTSRNAATVTGEEIPLVR